MSNAVVLGQNETGNGRGGWRYVLNNPANSDGSTVGWDVLGLLDAEAAGTIPGFVKTEFAMVLNTSHNTNGSFDYQSDGSPAALKSVGLEKGGIAAAGARSYRHESPLRRVPGRLERCGDRSTTSATGGRAIGSRGTRAGSQRRASRA